MSLSSFIVNIISKNSDSLSLLEGQLDVFNYSNEDLQDIKEGRKQISNNEKETIKKINSRVDNGILAVRKSNSIVKVASNTLKTTNQALDGLIKILKANPAPNIGTTAGFVLTLSDLLKNLSDRVNSNKGTITSTENSLKELEIQSLRIEEKNNRLKQITN